MTAQHETAPAARSSRAPMRVLHGAGNFRESLSLARRPEVEAIEADVWVRSGRLFAHHERPLGPLPLTIGPRGIRPEPRRPVEFAELLDAVAGNAELLVDLRSWLGDPAPDVARALLPLADRSHLRVSCESWAIADRLRAWIPDLRVAYSVRSEAQLRRYHVGQANGSLEPTDVSIRHTLLHSALEVESLRRWAGWIGVWTVGEARRARELASWRVDAVVSNDLAVLAAI